MAKGIGAVQQCGGPLAVYKEKATPEREEARSIRMAVAVVEETELMAAEAVVAMALLAKMPKTDLTFHHPMEATLMAMKP
jgi:hypothetical protein